MSKYYCYYLTYIFYTLINLLFYPYLLSPHRLLQSLKTGNSYVEPTNVKQIAGRAGRMSSNYKVGKVSTWQEEDLAYVRAVLDWDVPQIPSAGTAYTDSFFYFLYTVYISILIFLVYIIYLILMLTILLCCRSVPIGRTDRVFLPTLGQGQLR